MGPRPTPVVRMHGRAADMRLAHLWRAWRFGKSVCGQCGLIGLNNDATRRAARRACPGTPEEN